MRFFFCRVYVMNVSNASNNISVISWLSVLSRKKLSTFGNNVKSYIIHNSIEYTSPLTGLATFVEWMVLFYCMAYVEWWGKIHVLILAGVFFSLQDVSWNSLCLFIFIYNCWKLKLKILYIFTWEVIKKTLPIVLVPVMGSSYLGVFKH
jgi:hypothetical protein